MSKAAKSGHTAAMVEYAIRLFNGVGTKADEEAAALWFRKAAEAGSPAAQTRLARMLAEGAGVPANPVEAVKWYLVAARTGATDRWLDDFASKLDEKDKQAALNAAAAWLGN
jgi:hypothetical protein